MVFLAPHPPAQDLGQTVLSVNSYCTIILEYLVVWDINIILVKLKCLHPVFSLVILVRGVGGKLSRLVYLAPRPEFGSGSVISQFLLHHNLGILSCKRYKHYFSQTEMFTSNVQFGYPCPMGGGQAVQAGLSCQNLTQLNIWSKHFRLTEIKFITLSTKYSCSRWCNKICRLSILSEILGGGGKINRPGQLAPNPSSIRNTTERSK